MPYRLIRALGLVKRAAAEVNMELGLAGRQASRTPSSRPPRR